MEGNDAVTVVKYEEGEAVQVPDFPGEVVWCQPTANPFQHGCCDCGLAHHVEYRIVNGEGNPVSLEGLHLQLRFTTDREGTARLREARK